jgi:hypothetical protein
VVVAAAILATAFVLLNLLPLWHTDVWAHLKFGHWMVEYRALPEHEPFADLADKEAPYINFQWLSQLALYFVFKLGAKAAGGDELQQLSGSAQFLVTLHALLAVLRWGILFAALRRLSGSGAVACAGMLLAMVLSVPSIGVLRPQAFVEPLAAAILYVLSGPVLSKRGLIALGMIMILWANLHGSFLIGVILVAACVAYRNIQIRVEARARSVRPVFPDRPLRFLALPLTACACFVNPRGPLLYRDAFELSRNANIREMDEWRAIPWGTPAMYLLLGSLALVALTLITAWYLRPRAQRFTQHLPIVLFHVLVAFVLGVQTYFHVRLFPWWALLMPWVLAPHWKLLLDRFPAFADSVDSPTIRKTILTAAFAVLALRFSGPVQLLWDAEPKPLDKVLSAGTPWRLAAQLKAKSQDSKPLADWLAKQLAGRFHGRIFASESQADYLLWALPAGTVVSERFPLDWQMRIFVYTHVHLFPREIWEEAQRVKSGAPDWQEILDRRGVNLIIFECEEHPGLRARLHEAKDKWVIVRDEYRATKIRDPRMRIMIAHRR